MSTSHNRNPGGNNQYGTAPGTDDPELVSALQQYHREGKTSNGEIKGLLKRDTGIDLSVSTIKRRRNELGLHGSRSKRVKLTENEKEQVVMSQLDKDLAKRQGVGTIKARIAFDQGVHVSRDDVRRVMLHHEPEEFERRDPGSKKICRTQIVPIGIHERWSGDGHDKLYKIGFPIWAVVDFVTGMYLGAWVLPSNRLAVLAAYLFLSLVVKFKGLPLEFSSDCGTETVQIYGFASALREIFRSDISTDELPAHRYQRSIHNIVVERSWLRLRLEIGDNAVLHFRRGEEEGIYHPTDEGHQELCQWLWSKLLQQELDEYVEFRNARKTRRDNTKAGPSGSSRKDIFLMPEGHNLTNCLLPLTDEQVAVVQEIMEELEYNGVKCKDLMAFTSDEFASRADTAYLSLGLQKLTFENVWHVFQDMLSLL